MNDPVRLLLQARGCAPEVVDSGLRGLVDAWGGVAESVVTGYALTLDDYLNDMDVRYLIQAALDVAPESDSAELAGALRRADDAMLEATEPTGCLWGDDIADEEGLDPRREWWYFRRPRRPGEQLAEDLARWGLSGERA